MYYKKYGNLNISSIKEIQSLNRISSSFVDKEINKRTADSGDFQKLYLVNRREFIKEISQKGEKARSKAEEKISLKQRRFTYIIVPGNVEEVQL